MKVILNPEIRKIVDLLNHELDEENDLFMVGGAVRDVLRGDPVHDIDFVMPKDPRRFAKKVAKRMGVGYFMLDDARHTARVMYYTDDGQLCPLDFVEFTGDSLKEDLGNRDFTINAMALSVNELSDVLDPMRGMEDLGQGLLRTCSDHALSDDPVRVLRGIRFSHQLGFAYAKDLPDRLAHAAAALPQTSYERQRDEFFKILGGPSPALGMADCARFRVFETLIPPLVEQKAIPASPPHILSLFEHTLSVVHHCDLLLRHIPQDDQHVPNQHWWMSQALSSIKEFTEEIKAYFEEEITPGRSKYALMLLGALLHDIGKPSTLAVDEEGLLHFYGHDRVGGDLAWEAAKKLQLSNAECSWLKKLVNYHMRLLPMITRGEPTRRAIFSFFDKAGEVGVAIGFLTLANTLGTYGSTLLEDLWRRNLAVANAVLSAWWRDRQVIIDPEPLLNGDDLQKIFGLEPGKQIGKLLFALKEAQAGGEVNSQEAAKQFIRSRL